MLGNMSCNCFANTVHCHCCLATVALVLGNCQKTAVAHYHPATWCRTPYRWTRCESGRSCHGCCPSTCWMASLRRANSLGSRYRSYKVGELNSQKMSEVEEGYTAACWIHGSARTAWAELAKVSQVLHRMISRLRAGYLNQDGMMPESQYW